MINRGCFQRGSGRIVSSLQCGVCVWWGMGWGGGVAQICSKSMSIQTGWYEA